jgi:hypothetical protein
MSKPVAHELVMTRAVFNSAVFLLAQQNHCDPLAILQTPVDRRGCDREQWRRAMKMRRYAVYVTLTLFNLPQAHMAASLGISREAVRQMMERALAETESADLDYTLEQLAFLNYGGIDAGIET